MSKFVALALLALTSINCGASLTNQTQVALHAVSGKPVRMFGDKITVVNDGVDQVQLAATILWINEAIGQNLLTIESGYNSTIYINEDILPYEHPFDREVIESSPTYRHGIFDLSTTKLGRASFDAPENGVIKQCNVTINYFIPGPQARSDVMRHEILHCLGLRDDKRWTSVMNGYNAGQRPRLHDDQIDHLRSVYFPEVNFSTEP